ncbi:MAG: ABC transporter permease [Actinobacteria bacterium]|jgi:general nucleoside transport system permease protein|nr:ABC transporter permease [Actinomycetota bacterium]MBT3686544.1 ABC transporter permease [Actinomycetota bacterium]MBT4038368.1 ABC transporter permease [Actinomycetota bacterium]MBT4279462.1 ABC transporter permease [Actinomycetota bacterium]MBT4343604.1 ABC transporter permease [Actinomycetota bacterium]
MNPVPLKESRALRWMVAILGLVLVLSLTQELARPETTDLISAGTAASTLRRAVPILLAGLGGIWAERAGVVNIGLEGMMILGTWFGAWGALEFGPWWGIAIGIAGGAAGGLLHAVATVGFGVDHIISGVAINILAPGITRFLSREIFAKQSGGGITQSPRVESVGHFDVPFVSGGEIFGWATPDIFGWIDDRGWFVVSDLFAVASGITSNVSWATLLAIALVPGTVYVLWRTPFGLRVRSCGEHPVAADSLGVNVYRMKYAAVVISGGMAGFGGAFIAIEQTGIYREAQTQGRGFIGLATVIFGNWQPLGAFLGSILFGFADALQLRDRTAVHALLLLTGVAVGLIALRSLKRSQPVGAGVLLLISALMLWWYLVTDSVMSELPPVTPHIATLIVLVFATSRLRMPAADGMRYRKGQE